MAKPESEIGINSWLEDELYQQFLRDRSTVDPSWKDVFEEPRVRPSNGVSAPVAGVAPPKGVAPPAGESVAEAAVGDELQPLRGVAGKIAENMAASLTIPLATS